MEIENRCAGLPMTRVSVDCDVRARGKKAGTTLVGHAVVWGEQYDLGPFVETIQRGAFSRVLRSNQDTRALVDHQTGLMTIGRTSSGSLRLREDDRGLSVEIDLPDTTVGRDVAELVRRGDLSQMSIGFVVDPSGEVWTRQNDKTLRTIIEIDRLFDVSVVTFPASPTTRVEVARGS